MDKSFLLSGIVLILLAACNNKAVSFLDSPNAYLGQPTPSDTPRQFSPLILADSGIALDRVAFSPDGKEFYYCTNTTWYSTKDLKVRFFKFEDEKWKGPAILFEHFNAPTFSLDGNTLYFPGDDSLGGILWQSKRTAEGWTTPVIDFRRKYSLYDFMPTSGGNMYIGSNGEKGSISDYNSYDIQALIPSASDTTIHNLGAPLNTPGFDGDFFVARDESYIIISANETKDFECELHISFRKPDKTWTKPKSLGPLINDGLAHRWGQYVTPDGKYLFYTRATSEKDCYIYWVRFDNLLKNLKQ